MKAEKRLEEMGLTLPSVHAIANYVIFKRDGGIAYLSGKGPRRPDNTNYVGKVGADVTADEAYEHAKLVGLTLLASARSAAGDLDQVEILKVFGMVNAVPEFGEQAKVINGCSDLFVDVLGERGRHARSAIGVGSLPGGMTVEIEATIRIHDVPSGA